MNRHDLPLKYIGVAVIGIIAIILVTGGLYWELGVAGLQIASVTISGILTLALVILYYQQKTIDEKQTELMERDYKSSVFPIGQITTKGDYIYITLKNAGRGAVQHMYLRSEIVGDAGSLGIEPWESQVTAVEGNDSTLPAFSPPKEFKAKMLFTESRKSGKKRQLLFKDITAWLARKGIDECTIRFTFEIIDESTRTEEDIEEFGTDQEVTTPELVEQESDTGGIAPKTQLEDAIKPPRNILPHNFEERYRSPLDNDEAP